jgi:hypothetical protein
MPLAPYRKFSKRPVGGLAKADWAGEKLGTFAAPKPAAATKFTWIREA